MKIHSRRFHRKLWLVLGFVLPVIVLAAMVIKQAPPTDRPAVLLEKPEAN